MVNNYIFKKSTRLLAHYIWDTRACLWVFVICNYVSYEEQWKDGTQQ